MGQHKNGNCLIGRKGRKAIELDNLRMDAQRWRRKKATLEKFSQLK
jgi:hypothetical protein